MIFPIQPIGTNVAALKAITGGGAGVAPVLDGIVSGVAQTTTIVSNSSNLVTTSASDVIVVIVMTTQKSGSGLPPSVVSVVGTGGDIYALPFTFKSSQNITPGAGSSINVEFWFAAAVGVYSTGNIVTATCGTAFDDAAIILMGWSGCGTPSAPWDLSGSLPAIAHAAGTTIPTVTGISTIALGTVVLTACGAANAASDYADQSAGGSATILANVSSKGGNDYSKLSAEYQPFTAAQSGITQAFSGAWLNWNAISHALVGT